MARPTLELADIFRRHGAEYQQVHSTTLTSWQRRVLRAIEFCRTAVLGGHRDQCDRCGHQRFSYNSCRNRHCPKCQSLAKAKWLQARQAELLPVEYFHLVFTLPQSVAPVALQNKRVVYGMLFRAVAETLLEIARDPGHLGARIGFLAVLHTWGQNLLHHPHVHCVVPGGGISLDGKRWVACRPGFFLPVRVLSRLFRGKFLAYLRQAFDDGKLQLDGMLAYLANPTALRDFLHQAGKTDWVVYCKPPFGGPAQVLDYLGRYTHRVAISNHRLVQLQDGKVTFRWKDYRHGNRLRLMTLEAHEFIRRFLLHVLPPSFTRLRHYGLLGNRNRAQQLSQCRQLIQQAQQSSPLEQSPNSKSRYETLTGQWLDTCSACHLGHMVCVEILVPAGRPPIRRASRQCMDSS